MTESLLKARDQWVQIYTNVYRAWQKLRLATNNPDGPVRFDSEWYPTTLNGERIDLPSSLMEEVRNATAKAVRIDLDLKEMYLNEVGSEDGLDEFVKGGPQTTADWTRADLEREIADAYL